METKKNTVSISRALVQFRSEAIAERQRRKAEDLAAMQQLRVRRANEFRTLFEATFGTPLLDDVSPEFINDDEDHSEIPFVELSDLATYSGTPVYVLYVPRATYSNGEDPAGLRYAMNCTRCNEKFSLQSEVILVGPDWNPAVILDSFLARKPTECEACRVAVRLAPSTSSQRLLDALNAYLDERSTQGGL